MINYLTELAVIHLALMLGYWLLLRNEQQFAKMRFFIIGSTLLALIIPLIKLPKLFIQAKTQIDRLPIEVLPEDVNSSIPEMNTSIWSIDHLIWFYVIISSLFLIRFLKGLFFLIHLKRNSFREKFDCYSIQKVGEINGSFTFFNWIFLSDQIEKNEDYHMILQHEKAHVSLGHSYDLMFFELFKICFWWLPTTWFINEEIRNIHEYEADAYVLKSFNADQYSSILISSTLKSNGLGLASSFHEGLIQKRLKAMKRQTKKVSPIKLGTLMALFSILFLVFACTEEPGQSVKSGGQSGLIESKTDGEIYTIVEEWAQYPGGMDALYEFVSNEIGYPKEARISGVEGQIWVQFVVEKDGSLSNVQTVKGIGAGCDEEGERVLQSAASFIPASQRGKQVRVQMVMPIVFKIDKDRTNPDSSPQGIIIVNEVQHLHNNLKVEADFVNGEWSGTIYDEAGGGLPGANIVISGGATGTVSDLDGSFKLKANESENIIVSFVGYQSVKLEAE